MPSGLIGALPASLALALLTLFTGFVSSALGHSFTTVLVVPSDASETVRSHMVAAFLLAAHERDGHSDEESDGHLGGLDVYLVPVWAKDLAETDTAGADIIAAPLSLEAASSEMPEAAGAVLVGPSDPEAQMVAGFLKAAAGAEFAPFAQRFADQTGTVAGEEAIATYVAARRIDAAVRALGGVDDRDRLRALLSQ